ERYEAEWEVVTEAHGKVVAEYEAVRAHHQRVLGELEGDGFVEPSSEELEKLDADLVVLVETLANLENEERAFDTQLALDRDRHERMVASLRAEELEYEAAEDAAKPAAL